MASVNRHLKRLEERFDVFEYLKQFDTKEHGPNVSMTCPMCEKEDKLWVLLDEKKTSGGVQPAGSFVCYYCRDVEGTGIGKGPLALIRHLEDKTFIEGLKVLIAGGALETELDFVAAVERAFESTEGHTAVSEPLPTIPWPEFFKKITATRRPSYLRSRGIGAKKAMRYQLGYCTGGYFANRLILPNFVDNRLVGFQARYLKQKPPPGVKKTWFPKGTKTGRMLFNYDQARTRRRIIVTEDPFSSMAVGKGGVATFGTSVSQGQLELLLQSDAEELVLLWDRDALHKAWDLVEPLSEHWRIRVAELPDERDIDEHGKEARLEIIAAAKEVTAMEALEQKILWEVRSL